MTHHNATFLALSTDGALPLAGISENGDISVAPLPSLEAIATLIRTEVVNSIVTDIPFIVVVGKNKTRATAGEKFLELFALDIVRDRLATISDDLFVTVAGSRFAIQNSYFAPRVESVPLPWATKSTTVLARVKSLLDALTFGDEGLDVIPRGHTHVGV